VSLRVHATGTVSVLVRCSGNPFRVSALFELVLLLDQVKDALAHEYREEVVKLPYVGQWVVKGWEHGIDGRFAFEGESLRMPFETWSGVLAQFYLKDVGRGYRMPRLEVIETPCRPLDEALHQLLKGAQA